MINSTTFTQPMSERFALLYGILLGDGCISKVGKKYYFISIVGNLKLEQRFYSEIILPILEEFTQRKISIRKSVKFRKLEIIFVNKEFFLFLNSLGFPIGKKGNNLHIPNLFRIEMYKYIIQGYFATDGSLVICNNNGIIYPRIEFCGISKPLITQVHNYLLDIGMHGYIYKKTTYPLKNQQDQYRLQFNGKMNLEIFKRKIGFINFKQQDRYEFYLKKMPEEGFETSTSGSPGL
jgi:hypothetical protein